MNSQGLKTRAWNRLLFIWPQWVFVTAELFELLECFFKEAIQKKREKNMLPLQVYSFSFHRLMQIRRRIQTGLYVDWDDRCAYINVADWPRFRRLSEALCSVLEVFCMRDTETSVLVSVCVYVSEIERDSEKVHLKDQCVRFSSISNNIVSSIRVCSCSVVICNLSEEFSPWKRRDNCAVYTLQLIRTDGKKKEKKHQLPLIKINQQLK